MAHMWSQTLIPTARQVPADAEVPSHQLMLRGGMIHRLGSGIYSYLPLGWRSLRKVIQIIRDQMDLAGAVEVFLPSLQPIELWEKTGRRSDYGDNLFVVTDRHGRQQALGPTHEEVITEIAGTYINSYRDLPITLYQIQTKFRDEYRPRFGVLRSREFQMKDAYSFDRDAESLNRSYRAMYEAYGNIFRLCGLPYVVVEAESGEMGGSGSHQFTVLTATGEDTIFSSDKGDYAANLEKCATGKRANDLEGKPTGELQEVHTPGCKTIKDVSGYWSKNVGGKLKPKNMLKTLVFSVSVHLKNREPGRPTGSEHACIAVVRGDHEINEEKIRGVVSKIHKAPTKLSLMDEDGASKAGFCLGYVGPQVLRNLANDSTILIIDYDAANGGFWVTGANKSDHHVRHFNWARDLDASSFPKRIFVDDIRNAMDGDPAPDGGVLKASKGIEVGQVFKLGTKYTQAFGVGVLDEDNQRQPVIMGCYGIGANRILAAAIERKGGHDEHGIIWPARIAPYEVLVTPIRFEGPVKEVSQRLAGELAALGHDVLIDDRDERPGVKFKDADLIGIPLRITVGEKGLKEDQVELKVRQSSRSESVDVGRAAGRAVELLEDV